MGYLTLVDFSLYELVRYMDMIFPAKMSKFPKLTKIKDLVAKIPQI